MTAVASPIQLQQPQPPSRSGWNTFSPDQNGGGTMSQEDVGRAFMSGPRKSAQRTNSATSLNSATSSTSSTNSTSSNSSNGTVDGWGTRKKNNRLIWPQGKSEPTAGLSTARPQSVSTASSSGASAASAISALHTAPMPPPQQMANGQAQQNGTLRNGSQGETPPALLYLLPMNGTFERKNISVPLFPDVLRIGRQTNAKTAPTPTNGFFDSKVLSRQHAEVYAERSGRVFIRDVKSSNGTFVNGKRLSPENKESEPHELREQDVLELGIDIVSEDQKTVVHHKVAARVEHAGFYAQGGDIAFGDMDPSGNGFGPQQMKRAASQGSIQGGKATALAAAAMAARDGNNLQQQGWSRMWLAPITAEQVVKRLNRELTLARQQSSDIARAKQCLEGALDADLSDLVKEEKRLMNEKPAFKPSPVKTKTDTQHFYEPPAPPPRQPLPEKPDVAKALADPAIQPLLQRSDTARPFSFGNGSPTRADHSNAILILTQELKLAKDQVPSLEERVRNLEQQLRVEKTARETAEERANLIEQNSRKDSAQNSQHEAAEDEAEAIENEPEDGADDLRDQLSRLRASVNDMKQQMEIYRRRAETAESERDESRKTLAEMIEEKRKANAIEQRAASTPEPTKQLAATHTSTEEIVTNGHTIAPFADGQLAVKDLLDRAGVDTMKPLTKQQATDLRQLISQEMFDSEPGDKSAQWNQLSYHGIPHACAFSTVLVGLALMHYLNGWDKIQR